LSAEREAFTKYKTVTTVTADSHSSADTVDTYCLTVAAINKCYYGQINSEQGSYWRNVNMSIRKFVAVWNKHRNNLHSKVTNTSLNTNSTAILLKIPWIVLRMTKVRYLKFCGQKRRILLRMSQSSSSQ
jgi:hypothetical protein